MISHGMLIMGFVGQAITAWSAAEVLKKFGVRFAGMTKPGNTITITGTVTDKRQENGENLIFCEVVAQDENGDCKNNRELFRALRRREAEKRRF